ncbi:hypothetical protein [Limnobacter sp.]
MNASASSDSSSSKQYDGLQKQRRNFIVGSFLLCFVAIGGVSLDRITTAGLAITVKNPSAAYWFIWVAVVYFGIRYSQFLWSERKTLIPDSLALSLGDVITRLSLKELRAPSHVTVNSISPPYANFKDVAVVSWAQIINKRSRLWEIRAEFTCPGDLTQPLSKNRPIGHIVYSVQGIDIFWLRARALGHWVLETPHCLEYVAPYFLFIVAVIVNAF